MGLWSQVKNRRITQVLLAYLAGGWMALAVVDQFVDREVLPAVLYHVGLTLYVFGIGWALVIGWYHGEKGQQRATPSEIFALAVFALPALFISGRMVRTNVQEARVASVLETSRMDLRRIAVLYFSDSTGDAELVPVADALTEALIAALAQVSELDVVSRNGSESVRGLGIGPDSAAAIFDAGTVIDGSVGRVGDGLRVTVRLLDGQSGTPLVGQPLVLTVREDSLVSAGDELAKRVSVPLREIIGQEIRVREGRSGAPNSAAWLHVARAEKALKDGVAALRRGDGEGASTRLTLAEEEAAAAALADARWVEPMTLRGRVAYERYALATTLEELAAHLEEAIGAADAAVRIEPNNAAALELRGTARYRLWLMQLEDDDTLDAMLEAARGDLERAKSLDRRVAANANSVLSHLYYQVGDWGKAILSAQDAYRQDAFLAAADAVLRRLYQASYDMGEYEEARDWCLEGRRRFPDNFRFVQCQLYVLTMEDAAPDVDEAWALYDEFASLLPEGQAPLLSALGRTFLGGVLGRAGLPDSATAVLARARVDRDVDPESEQVSMEAAMRSVFGDVDGSIEALERYMILNPGHFPGEHWWWRSLRGNPDFERLQAIR